jgi:hypothetical protein
VRAKVVEKGKREREIGKKAQRVREWEKEKAKEGDRVLAVEEIECKD